MGTSGPSSSDQHVVDATARQSRKEMLDGGNPDPIVQQRGAKRCLLGIAPSCGHDLAAGSAIGATKQDPGVRLCRMQFHSDAGTRMQALARAMNGVLQGVLDLTAA